MPKKTTPSKIIELPILQHGGISSSSSQAKRGRGRVRALVLILVHLLILTHIIHFWIAGRSLSPMEPSESMYTIELGQVNSGAILFVLAIASTVVFGRFFCGWGCHLVALQDLSGHLLRRVGFRPQPLRSRLLIWTPFMLAFYMFFWPTLKRLWRGDQHPGFSNHLMTENFWYTFPGLAVSILTFAVCGGLIIYLLGNKGFCTYACPYGAFFTVADRLAVGRIHVTDACLHCGQCTAHCTSNVQVHAEVRDFGMVIDPGCMKCMDCVSVCPNDALYFGLKKRPGSGQSSHTLPNSSKPPRSKKTYDFTFSEELLGLIVAGITVYAMRGLYDITPLLLSVAVGVITAYLTIHFFRIFHQRNQRIQHIQIKKNCQITWSGWMAVVFMFSWFVFIAHSVVVQYHRYHGRQHMTRIGVTWDELLNLREQPRLTEEDHANIDIGLKSYQFTDRIGFFKVKEVKLGMAIGSLMKRDLENTERYLRQAYQVDPPGVREMMMEFLVAQDRQAEASEIR